MSSNNSSPTHSTLHHLTSIFSSIFRSRPLVLASLTSLILSFSPILSVYFNDSVADLQVFIFLQTIVGILITASSSLWLSLCPSNMSFSSVPANQHNNKFLLILSLSSIPILSFFSALNPWFLTYFLFFRSYSLRTPFYLKCAIPIRLSIILLSLLLYFFNATPSVLFSLVYICGVMVIAFGYLPLIPFGFFLTVVKSSRSLSSFVKSFFSASAFELYVAILPSLLLLLFRSIKSGTSYESFLELLAVSSALSFISTGIDTVFTKRAFIGQTLLTRKLLSTLAVVAFLVFILSLSSSLFYFGNGILPSLLFACLVSLGPLNSLLSIFTRRYVSPSLLLKSVVILIPSVMTLLALSYLVSVFYGSSLSLYILTWLLAALLYVAVMIYLLRMRSPLDTNAL